MLTDCSYSLVSVTCHLQAEVAQEVWDSLAWTSNRESVAQGEQVNQSGPHIGDVQFHTISQAPLEKNNTVASST